MSKKIIFKKYKTNLKYISERLEFLEKKLVLKSLTSKKDPIVSSKLDLAIATISLFDSNINNLKNGHTAIAEIISRSCLEFWAILIYFNEVNVPKDIHEWKKGKSVSRIRNTALNEADKFWNQKFFIGRNPTNSGPGGKTFNLGFGILSNNSVHATRQSCINLWLSNLYVYLDSFKLSENSVKDIQNQSSGYYNAILKTSLIQVALFTEYLKRFFLITYPFDQLLTKRQVENLNKVFLESGKIINSI